MLLLLLLLSRFSRVRLYATPQTAAHQAPPSLGFSRQEHLFIGTVICCIFCREVSLDLLPILKSGSFPLLLLSHFSRVRLYATPQTAAHQAPLSLGFSRQEHWSGLPFPFPMHESEK